MNRNREIAEPRGGTTLNVRTYQLDRLFGLALTDVRFFSRLREAPEEALIGFSLTASEERAILSIVPSVCSIEELAVRLEDWSAHTGDVLAEGRTEDQFAALRPTVWRLSLASTAQREPIPEYVDHNAS